MKVSGQTRCVYEGSIDNMVHICNISIRVYIDNFRDYLNNNFLNDIRKINKQSSLEYIPTAAERYAGTYININGIPVNFKPCENNWFSKAGNLPGKSRYRCIIEPVSSHLRS